MSKRTAFWLAWFTWVLYLVIAIVTLLFQIKNAPSELLSDIFNALVLLAFATVGSLIASRRPENQHFDLPISFKQLHKWFTATYCRLHAGNCSALSTVATSYPKDHRPSLLPPQVRCSPHTVGFQRKAAQRGGFAAIERAPANGGSGDDAAHVCLAVVASI
jgi:hypothetical protein